MKKNFTLKTFLLRREGWITVLVLTSFFFFGCYEFFSIHQPTTAYANDSFDVPIVVKSDAAGDNDWSVSPMENYGIFGVLVPDGWVVKDSVEYQITSTDSALATSSTGTWVKADKNHANSGYLLHSVAYSDSLTAKQGVPPGYHWWGSISNKKMDLAFFDSCAFVVHISTDSKTGSFFLQYTIGDEDYAGRRPVHKVSDVLQIDVTAKSSVENTLGGVAFKAYPNPTNGPVTFEFSEFRNSPVRLTVFNLTGQKVMSTTINSAASTIDMSNLAKGTYLITLKDGSSEKTFKLVRR